MHERRASTLIELLVTIALVAVLAGLLLSAVQKVRAAASRLSCQNRMRQIGLGAIQHHDAAGGLPGVNSFFPPVDFALLGWLPRLLPYVEQGNAWAEAQEDYRRHPFPFGKTHRNINRVIPIYTCPADDRAATAWIIPGTDWPTAFSSYLANAGTAGRNRDGVVYPRSKTQLLHISDGTSNTVLFGERPPSPDFRFGWWYSGHGAIDVGLLDFTMTARETGRPVYPAYRDCPKPAHFQPSNPSDACGALHYWSLHDGGANFAFCDGSVRFLRYEADAILPALMTRAGGEVIPGE